MPDLHLYACMFSLFCGGATTGIMVCAIMEGYQRATVRCGVCTLINAAFAAFNFAVWSNQ